MRMLEEPTQLVGVAHDIDRANARTRIAQPAARAREDLSRVSRRG